MNPLRPLFRLRRWPERLRHSHFRRRALERLEQVPAGPILVVCHGNICRSPFGEHLLRQLLAETGSSRSVASAGFIGPGRPSPPPAIAEAAAFGVDLVPHRSQLLTREAVERAAVIVVMDGAQAAAVVSEFGADPNRVVVLGDLDPAPRVERRVIDPVEQPAPVFRACYERMARCLTVLANALAERGAGVS